MKTRADIYGQEAADLLREVSMYPGLSEGQLARFHQGREEKVRNLLAHLQRQGRIVRLRQAAISPRGNMCGAPMQGWSVPCGCSWTLSTVWNTIPPAIFR